MDKKIIGIIGGMGPLATADLFKKIIRNTQADKDQDHLRILIDNNTDIPDRTAAILYGGEDPLPQLVHSAKTLSAMGAQILVMPCNTAHYFYDGIQKSVDVPLLSMIQLTGEALTRRGIRAAGLLATEGTIRSGIYQNVLTGAGIDVLTPSDEEQVAITNLIYRGVKAGDYDYDITDARAVMERLLERGAQILILGCTELPLAMDMYGLDFATCDPTTELAKGAIRAAGGQVRE
jgi:aspartate racemase